MVADQLAGAVGGRFHVLAVAVRCIARVRAGFPVELERLAAVHRRPGAGRDHGHAGQRLEGARDRRALDLHHLHDARHLHRLGGVEAAQRAAVDRRAGDDREQHVGQHHVHAVDGLAGGHVEAVDERRLPFADVAEVGRLLQTQLGARRHRQLGGIGGHFAEADGAAAGLVDQLMVPGLHLGRRHAPARGRRALQHLPCRGAAAAHRHEEVARGARAVGVLVAVAHLVARRLHHAHLGPVRFQLVGQDHRHAGAHALTHLGAVAGDGDDAVAGNGDEDQRVLDHAVGHAVGAVLGRLLLRRGVLGPAQRQREAADAGGGGADEVAARQLQCCSGHVMPP